MQTLPYVMMQDRLSTGGSFILCDANADGFPIRYASQGFVDLFGFPAAECMGRKCGDLVAAPIAQDPDVAGLPRATGLSQPEVAKALQFLTEFTAEEVRKMVLNPSEHIAFALVLNRRRNKGLFVNELVMHSHHHPTFGWSYCVGLQRDATREVTVKQLLYAAARGGYEQLVQSRQAAMKVRVSKLGIFGDQAIQYLHEKAGEMWQNMMPRDCRDLKSVSSLSSSTSVSGYTESGSCSDSASQVSSSNASSLRLVNRGMQETSKVLAGTWKGVVSKELGGYEQTIEFFEDGVTARIEAMKREAAAEYSLDTSSEPHRLDIRLLPDVASSGAPLPPPVHFIARLEGDTLHLCSPFPTSERPRTFEGPGYSLMSRVSAGPGHGKIGSIAEEGAADVEPDVTMGPMQTMPYILMQDRLSTGGSFILCDANAEGFPIRYASRGFVDLFGHCAADCVGKKCGDLVAAPVAQDPGLAPKFGLARGDVEKALNFLKESVAEEVRKMIANPAKHVTFSLVLNKTREGKIFVCELVMHAHQHPTFGWSYCVGLQGDVTKEVSIPQLIHAALTGGYDELVKGRRAAMERRVANLGLSSEQGIRYLHEKAAEMWRDLMVVGNQKPKSLSEHEGGLSTAYISESRLDGSSDASSTRSSSRGPQSSVASSRTFSIQGEKERALCKKMAGAWKGTVSEALGAYEQTIEFLEDGTARIEVMGREAGATFLLDCSRDPNCLNLRLQAGSVPEGTPPPPPMRYIVRLQGDELHLCCPFENRDRPRFFGGPGYVAMTRTARTGGEPTHLGSIPEGKGVEKDSRGPENQFPQKKMPLKQVSEASTTVSTSSGWDRKTSMDTEFSRSETSGSHLRTEFGRGISASSSSQESEQKCEEPVDTSSGARPKRGWTCEADDYMPSKPVLATAALVAVAAVAVPLLARRWRQ